MKGRRTHESNDVFKLEGGTEDNDLWVERREGQWGPEVASVWVPSDDERAAIARGDNIELVILGRGIPPLMMHPTNVRIGKPPGPTSG